MNFKNKILTRKAIELISISLFSVLLVSNVLNSNVYGQQLLQVLGPNIDNGSDQGLDIRITSLIPNQLVPVGNLTISGTSDYNKSRDCVVYVGLNGLFPFKKAFANGTNGINDYSDWNFTFSPSYQQILNGTNKIDSRLSCVARPENLTQTYSLNVTGVLNGNLTNQSSSTAAFNISGNDGDPSSFTNSEDYRQGSDAFRACIDAATSVGDKLSDYEIQNCREDPSYRHGLGDYSDSSSSTDSGDSSIDPISTYDSGSSSDSGDTGSSSTSDQSSDGSGDGASSTKVCSASNTKGRTKIIDGVFNVGAAGDWSGSTNACKTALNMENKGVDLALGLGDYAYSSGFEGVTSWWEDVMAPLHGIFKGALGNHDTQDKGAYAHYFGQSGPWFYSFNEHGIHFLALDLYSSFGSGSTQYKFVSDDLAAASVNPAVKWIIVFFHEPMYTSPSHHPPVTSLRNAYHPLFDKYGVDLILQGHNHNYQRTFPISYNPDSSPNPTVTSKETDVYTDPVGQIYMEVGTGGQDSYPLDGKLPFVYKQFTTSGGFLDLAFPNTGTLKASYYDNDGSVKDEFTINKPEIESADFIPKTDTAVTFEDTPVVIPVLGYDKGYEGQSNYSSVIVGTSPSSAPTHGSVILNHNKTVTYVPENNYFGTDSFSYTLGQTKGHGDYQPVSSATVNVKINAVNDPPIAVNDNASVNKDGILPSINLISNDKDPDGDPITITNIDAINSSNGNAINNGDGTISYIPAKGYVGTASYVYTISDSHNASSNAIVTIDVNEPNLNLVPVSFGQNVNTSINKPVSIHLSAADPNSGTLLTYSLVTEPSHGQISDFEKGTGILIYSPIKNYSGFDSFSFISSDGKANSNIADVKISVESTPLAYGVLVNSSKQQDWHDDISQVQSSSNASLKQPNETVTELTDPSSDALVSNNTHQGEPNYKLSKEAQVLLDLAQMQLKTSFDHNYTKFVPPIDGKVKQAITNLTNDSDLFDRHSTKSSRLIAKENAAKQATLALSDAKEHENNSLYKTQNNGAFKETNISISNSKVNSNDEKNGNEHNFSPKSKKSLDTVSLNAKDSIEKEAYTALTKAEKQLQGKIVGESKIADYSSGTQNDKAHEPEKNIAVSGQNIDNGSHKPRVSQLEVTKRDIKDGVDRKRIHADAGPDIAVYSVNKDKKIINLNGRGSSSGSGSPGSSGLSYTWKQIAGPHVDLIGSNQKISSFSIPSLPPGKDKVVLKFKLTVTILAGNNERESLTSPVHDSDTAKITIKQGDLPNSQVKTKAPNLGPNDRNIKLEKVQQNQHTDSKNTIADLGDSAPGLSDKEHGNNLGDDKQNSQFNQRSSEGNILEDKTTGS